MMTDDDLDNLTDAQLDALTSPEAPTSPDAPEPAPAAHSDDDAGTGTPRDERGRFAPKEQPETEAPGTPPADADPTAAAPTAPTEDSSAAVDPAAPPTPPEPDPVPFAFKASGRDVAIDGATYVPGKGLSIPDERLPQVQQILAAGHDYLTRGRQEIGTLRRELEATKAERVAKETENQTIAAELAALFELDDDSFVQAAYALKANAPVLREQARAAELEAEVQRLRQATAPDPETVRTQAEEALFGDMEQAYLSVAGEFANVPHAEQVELAKSLWERRDDYLRPMTAEEARYFGKQGLIFDDQKYLRDVRREAGLYARAVERETKAQQQARQAASAAQQAATYNQHRKPNAAPPPVAGGAATVPAKAGAAVPQTLDEWEAAMKRK